MKKIMKNISMQYFAVLILVLCLCLVKTDVRAELSDEAKEGSGSAAVETADGYTEWMDLGETMTSAPSMFQLFSTDGVSLKEGYYTDWIDRIAIPDYARDLYDRLVEASDNDGVNDWLIDVTQGTKTDKGDYVVEVTGFTGQAASETAVSTAVTNQFNQINVCIRAVFDAFDRDHPEIFWLSGKTWTSVAYSYSRNGSAYKYTATVLFGLKTSNFDIRAAGHQDTKKIKEDIRVRDQQVKSITGTVINADTVKKIQGLNRWLTQNNGYNTSGSGKFPTSAHVCLAALMGNRGTAGPVCEGYARAFKVLCDAVEIPCTLVDGMAINSSGRSEGHMWNYVCVEARWYAVDVTWNDSLLNGSDTLGMEDYLLVGADTEVGGRKFIASHPVSNRVSTNGIAFTNGPTLNSSKYNSAAGKVSVEDCQIKFSQEEFVYDGTAICPEVQVSNGTVLKKDVDYVVSYKNNRNTGIASVEIQGKGDYTGTVTKNFTIVKASQTVTASLPSSIIQAGQTGQIVVDGIGTITYSSDNTAVATVSNAGLVTGAAAGTARITVTAAGNSNVESGSTVLYVTVTKVQPENPSAPSKEDGKEEEAGTGEPGDTSATNPQPTVPAKGTKLTDSKTKSSYKVSKAGATVAYTGTTNKNAASVKIPSTVKLGGVTYKVTSIASNAFKNYKKLKTVTIGANMTDIGSSAFLNCTALTKITIPAKVTKIGSKAFYGCKKLTSITIKSQKLTTKSVGSKAFTKAGSSNYKKLKVTVPKKNYAAYKKLLKAKGLSTKAKVAK